MFKNFLPEDTRLAELASCISMLIISVLLVSGQLTSFYYTSLFILQRVEFWAAIFLIFGGLQLLSILYYLKLDVLRCVTSLSNGCFLIWISLGTMAWDLQLTDISTFVLGITNLYAFTINSLQIGKVWAK